MQNPFLMMSLMRRSTTMMFAQSTQLAARRPFDYPTVKFRNKLKRS